MNSGARVICSLLALILMASWLAAPVLAKPGNVDQGEQVYTKRCVFCHGEEGDGTGSVAERLNPPPRDFTAGVYKIATSTFDEMVPQDEDIFRMIRDGMPGTVMPGWDDVLSEQDMWDLVAYVKAFAYEDEEQPAQVDYGTRVPSSPESIEAGKKLFHDGDRCSECHGEDGKGNAIKKLKGDYGERTWPRNLTKPWAFRGSNDPKDIFTRISLGIPGTQMPVFSDPESKKKLSIEERWHVANYVNSLADTEKAVRAENTVIKADKADGNLPDSPDDPRWIETEPSSFFLVPQIIAEQRFFTPSNDTITVRALYNEQEIALLLEWDDRTKSIPGNEKAEKISDPGIAEDAVAVQLPVEIPDGTEKPYFGMGDPNHPVNIWHWSSGTEDIPESLKLINSTGFGNIEARDAAMAGIRATGIFDNGTWRVVMKRALATSDPENDIQFVEGKFIPVAFAAWDGSNSEKGSRHTLTTWYWLLLKPPADSMPLLAALFVTVLVAGGLIWWARGAVRKEQD